MNLPPSLPSGWFPDPHGRYDHRWFNGTTWTADVADAGQRLVDPLGAAPQRFHSAPQLGAGNGLATAAITCGLIALLFAWMPFLVVIGFVLGLLGVVFGARGMRRAAVVGSGRGRAIAGLVTGSASLALSVVGVALSVMVIKEVQAFLSPGRVEVADVGCRVDGGEIVVFGSLTNRSGSTRDYTLYGVLRSPRGIGDLVTEVRDVEPNETRQFQLQRPIVLDGASCEARVAVHGPLPYGRAIDRVNDPRD